MNRVIVIGLVTVVLGACKPMEPSRPKVVPDQASSADEMKPSRTVDISSVEFAVSIAGELAKQSEAPNITVDELVGARRRVDMATINVTPPYPETLWLAFRAASAERFPETPVVLRINVKMDETVVGSFSTVLGGSTGKMREEYTMDILATMEEIPETVLVYAQAEALLMPEGTDPASIDPETATVSAERTGTIIGNPVRVNFIRAGNAP